MNPTQPTICVALPEGAGVASALWRSEAARPAPQRIQCADDSLSADAAYRLIAQGSALLWRGDYHNARQLLQALARRIDRRTQRRGQVVQPHTDSAALAQAFARQRQAQAQRAQMLGAVLVVLDEHHRMDLRRAPDVHAACSQAWGSASASGPALVALRELQGVIGAYEWRRKGLPVAALGQSIYPHYGVFSPVRGEYLDLVAQTPLPALDSAFDIGTGTGVLAALLARRGVRHVVATDIEPRAVACAQDNIARLGLQQQVQVLQADMFAPGRASLVLCNPPWVPAAAHAPLERAVYDQDSQMLRAYLTGLPQHLSAGGQGWLILSDLAEHLGLRTEQQLLQWISQARLQVLGRHSVRARHPKVADTSDPLHKARAQERTWLWRLGVKDAL